MAYFSGTSGKAARDSFLREVAPKLDTPSFPGRVYKGAGFERVQFENGSVFQVCATADDFRGRRFDVIILDEAGEMEPDRARDILAAAQPTQDTVSAPLMVIAGTAGKVRKGNPLWEFLERGRAEDPRVAILEYSAERDLTLEDVETWEQTEPLLVASHPGIGTLTTLAAVRDNFDTFDRETFLREYLSVFSDSLGEESVLHAGKWEEAALSDAYPEELPKGAALAFAVHREQTSAAVAAAWRDEDGAAHVVLVKAATGETSWLPAELDALATRYPRTVIAYDRKGAAQVEGSRVRRAKLTPLGWSDVQNAAALFVRELNRGELKHYGQRELNLAARDARRRAVAGRAFAFGTPASGGNITPLEAASLALHAFDEQKERKPLPRMVAA